MSARRLIQPHNSAGLVALSGSGGRGMAAAGNSLMNLGVKFAQDKRLAAEATERANAKTAAATKERGISQDKLQNQLLANQVLFPKESEQVMQDFGGLGELALSRVDLSKMPTSKTNDNYTLGSGRYSGETNKLIAGLEPSEKGEKLTAPFKVNTWVGDDGFARTQMSDGNVFKATTKSKVSEKTKKEDESKWINIKGFGRSPRVEVPEHTPNAVKVGVKYYLNTNAAKALQEKYDDSGDFALDDKNSWENFVNKLNPNTMLIPRIMKSLSGGN